MFLFCCTRFERMLVNNVDSPGVLTFNISIMFYTRLEAAAQQGWFPGSGHIQRFWVLHTPGEDAGQQRWFPGSAGIQRFWCVLHAVRGCRATTVISWECPHSTFLWCLSCFERMPGNKADSLWVPTLNVSGMFYHIERMAGDNVYPWRLETECESKRDPLQDQ